MFGWASEFSPLAEGPIVSGILGSLTAEEFLRRHWQKKPLFIPAAFPQPESLLSPDECAGLALEDEVESRLVFEKRGRRRWVLERGPFDETTLRKLPRAGWSLLVQGLERLLPEFASVLPMFSFIPAWRLDDLMVSLAPDGGSVGPHLDRYDVFLIQLRGERRWEISDRPLADDFMPDVDLRILRDFKPTTTHIARPGDILYLPPRFGHHGVAQGTAMTLSVGFRAPRVQDILASLAHTLEDEDTFYEDPNLSLTARPGLIDGQAIARVGELVKALADDPAALASAFGRIVTTPRRFKARPTKKWTSAKVDEALRAGKALTPMIGLRLAYAPTGHGMSLFVEGEEWDARGVSSALLAHLGGGGVIAAKELRALVKKAPDKEMCARLLSLGAYSFKTPSRAR